MVYLQRNICIESALVSLIQVGEYPRPRETPTLPCLLGFQPNPRAWVDSRIGLKSWKYSLGSGGQSLSRSTSSSSCGKAPRLSPRSRSKRRPSWVEDPPFPTLATSRSMMVTSVPSAKLQRRGRCRTDARTTLRTWRRFASGGSRGLVPREYFDSWAAPLSVQRCSLLRPTCPRRLTCSIAVVNPNSRA